MSELTAHIDTQNLREGDMVAIRPRTMYEHSLFLENCRVIKVTTTTVKVLGPKGEGTYNRRNGDEWGRGDSWRCSGLVNNEWAKKQNASRRLVAERVMTYNRIRDLLPKVTRKMPLEALQTIEAALKLALATEGE